MKGDSFSLNLDETFNGRQLNYELLTKDAGAQINTIFHERFLAPLGSTKLVKLIYRISNQYAIVFFEDNSAKIGVMEAFDKFGLSNLNEVVTPEQGS